MQLNSFREYSRFKRKYQTLQREPFFEVVAGYIPPGDIVVDIGSGEGGFYNYLKRRGIDVGNVFLLDGNPVTVEKNKSLTDHSLFYLAPERLPFEDSSVGVVHMSHLVDNLWVGELYDFLFEVNRVLRPGGCLAISTPMLWYGFYNDLSHTKPYNPYVFYKYFVNQQSNSRFDKIPADYKLEKLVYRYYEKPLDEGWSSTNPFIDSIIISWRRILRNIGLRRLYKNGYTLVLRKNGSV